jgi:hypothetical protein
VGVDLSSEQTNDVASERKIKGLWTERETDKKVKNRRRNRHYDYKQEEKQTSISEQKEKQTNISKPIEKQTKVSEQIEKETNAIEQNPKT